MKYTLVLRFRLLFFKLITATRIYYYRLLGMKIGEGTVMGSINIDWPNKVQIGDQSIIKNMVFFTLDSPFSTDNLISIGNRVFIGDFCKLHCKTQIIIGDDCLIAAYTTLVDAGHSFDKKLRYNQQTNISFPIILESDVWLATNCTILSGVTIGKGSAVGAGSLVNKSIPPYEFWAGSPARFIRKRE